MQDGEQEAKTTTLFSSKLIYPGQLVENIFSHLPSSGGSLSPPSPGLNIAKGRMKQASEKIFVKPPLLLRPTRQYQDRGAGGERNPLEGEGGPIYFPPTVAAMSTH